MCPYDKQIDEIVRYITNKYRPLDIYLFGSCARGIVAKHSDIDICVIVNTDNKRKMAMDIQLGIECDADVDIVIYTPDEWQRHKSDPANFAYIIANKGVSLVGRYQEIQ